MTGNDVPWTPPPWFVDGPPYNQIVWSDSQSRVCFLAHSDGRDKARDLATGRLIAAAPEMAEALAELVGRKGTPQDHWICHAGITTKEECCECGPFIRAASLLARIHGE